MAARKVIVGILLVAVTVNCIPTRRDRAGLKARTSVRNRPPTTLKAGPPPTRKVSNIQPQLQGTTSQDPLSELVSALAPILKTLTPVLQSLAPSLQKLGPVLDSLLSSLLPQNTTTGGATSSNPLGSLVGNLLSKPNPIGNLVGGLLGKPAGTPLTDTLGSVVGGLTGTASTKTNVGKGSNIQSQPQGTASQDPLSELVSALTPILKTLAPVLESLAPSLKKLGPVLESLLDSLLPPSTTVGGATPSNPLGSLVGNLLSKPNPVGNLVGGLLGKPAGTPLTDTLGSVVGGLTGTAPAPTKTSPSVGSVVGSSTTALGSVGSLAGSLLGGGPSSVNVPSVSSLTAGLLGRSSPVRSLVSGAGGSALRNVGSVAPQAGRLFSKTASSNYFQSGRIAAQSSMGFQRPQPAQRQTGSAYDQGKAAVGRFAGESCESSCPYTYDPVCTVSGSTYDNKCMQECSRERFQCYGECPCVHARPPLPQQCPCNPYEYDPVCTLDGKQLSNKCLAICQHKVIACSSHCPC